MKSWFSRRAATPFYCFNTLPATAYQQLFLQLSLLIQKKPSQTKSQIVSVISEYYRRVPYYKNILSIQIDKYKRNFFSQIFIDTVVSTSAAFLVFFHAFSYGGVCFHRHSPLYGKNLLVLRCVKRKTAEFLGLNSFVKKRTQNREKTTSGDY